MIFVFEKDKREIHCYSEVDCLYLIGNKVHICNVVEEYSSEEMANKAFRTIRFRIGWGYEIARSEGSVAVHMPTEYELNNEKKQFENPLYTIAVYRIPRDEESFRKYLKNLFDDILTEVDYIIQGDTVEDLEKELKDKPIWDGSFYTLFENLRKNVFTKIQLAPKDQEAGYTLPFDMEQLCSVSILGRMRFGKEDIEKLAITYTYGIRKGVTEDLSTYLKYAPYILGMCKAYRQVKEYYFENNQENVITEIESVKDELNQTRSKLVAAEEQRVIEQRNSRKQIQHLTEELKKKQKEIQLLQAQLEKQATDKQELHALREYIFSLGESGDAEDWSESDKLSTEQIGELNQISGTIVGGHPIWVKKIKAQLSSWQYISVGDETTVRNAALRKTDLVCFVTAHLSHTLYYAMVSKSQDWGAQIGYINRTNVNMALCELWDLTHREK